MSKAIIEFSASWPNKACAYVVGFLTAVAYSLAIVEAMLLIVADLRRERLMRFAAVAGVKTCSRIRSAGAGQITGKGPKHMA